MTRYAPAWLQAGSYAASVDRRVLGALWPTPASSGCQVTAGTAMQVLVQPGSVAVPSQNNTGTTLCASDATEAVTIAAAPASGTNRYDVIICRPRGNDLDGGANNDFIFDVVVGTALASPVVPATPAGTVALANVFVPGGSASVIAGNITDVRPGNLAASSGPTAAGRGVLAQATSTSNSAGTATNVNWYSAPAFTVDGTRRVKVTYTGVLQSGTVGDLVSLRLMEGATILNAYTFRIQAIGGGGQQALTAVWQGVPAAGAHTYTLNVFLQSGTGAVTALANAGLPSILLVEDIGT